MACYGIVCTDKVFVAVDVVVFVFVCLLAFSAVLKGRGRTECDGCQKGEFHCFGAQ